MPCFQFSRRLGASHRASGVFASNSNSEKESICCERGEKASYTSSCSIASRTQRSEDEQDDSRDEKTPLARPMVTCVSESQLPDNCACKGNRSDILLCGGLGVAVAVDSFESGIDRSNDRLQVSI